jgi:hypothetical protein
MTELQLLPLDAEGLPGVAYSFAAAFHVPRTLAQWRHRFLAAPSAASIAYGQDRDKPLAFYGATLRSAHWRGRTLRVGQIVDVFTHPDAREPHPGLFVHNAESFYDRYCGPDGIQVLYGYPSPGPWRQGSRSLQYRRLRPPQWLECSCRSQAEGSGLSMAGRLQVAPNLLPGLSTAAFRFEETEASLLWRFPLAERDYGYVAWSLDSYDGGPRRAELLFRLKDDEAYLMRWRWSDPAVSAGLWRRVLVQLQLHGVTKVRAMVNEGHGAMSTLTSLGFVQTPPVLPLIPCFRVFDPSIDVDMLMADIDYTLADTDLY